MSPFRSYQLMLPNCIPHDLPSEHLVHMFGRFKTYDSAKDELLLEYKGSTIRVDTSCLEPMAYHTMSQIEVFGDLIVRADGAGVHQRVIEARILKAANDADLNITEQIIPILLKCRHKR